jgi:hypothetical protein
LRPRLVILLIAVAGLGAAGIGRADIIGGSAPPAASTDTSSSVTGFADGEAVPVDPSGFADGEALPVDPDGFSDGEAAPAGTHGFGHGDRLDAAPDGFADGDGVTVPPSTDLPPPSTP